MNPSSLRGAISEMQSGSGYNNSAGSAAADSRVAAQEQLPQEREPSDDGKKPNRVYIRYEVSDLNGKALSKTVPERHRDDRVYMYSGALALGANAEVMTFPTEVSEGGYPNWQLKPDWNTEQVLPWCDRPGITVKRVHCEHLRGTPDDSPVNYAVPRFACRRLLEELRITQQIELLCAVEYEFVILKPNPETKVLEPFFKGFDIFSTLQQSKVDEFTFEIERCGEAVGIDVNAMNIEYGEGQLEITFAPKFGIAALDAAATFRTMVKEIAQKMGLFATFMSKPSGVNNSPGNGGHLNFSLWKRPGTSPRSPRRVISPRKEPTNANGTGVGPGGFNTQDMMNALYDSKDTGGMSIFGKMFLAGVIEHAPAMEAFCAPTPPCYCRHGNWAPTHADWGYDDRSACVRVKADPMASERRCFMELRQPSSSSNPYLVTAAVVAAGLDGVNRKLTLTAPRKSQMDKEARALPTSLGESLAALEADVYMVDKLGPDLVRWFCGVKRAEIDHLNRKAEFGKAPEEEVLKAWKNMYMEML